VREPARWRLRLLTAFLAFFLMGFVLGAGVVAAYAGMMISGSEECVYAGARK
jgi:hypothetical protein